MLNGDGHERTATGSGGRRAGGSGRRVLVLGGTSEIALAIVRELQRGEPREVALVGREEEALARAAEDLLVGGCARVLTFELDALAVERHAETIAAACEQLGGVDLALVAVGVLGATGLPLADVDGALHTLRVNVLGAGSLLLHAAEQMRAGGGGELVVLSSVAAERVRRANFLYGASKAGLDALGQGLGDALARDGVHVLVVRPGFVRTRMTAGLAPAPLATTPQAVARTTVAGLRSGRRTVWAPPALRWLMLLVRALPRALFVRIER